VVLAVQAVGAVLAFGLALRRDRHKAEPPAPVVASRPEQASAPLETVA
jgi:hypothetical protein